MASGSGVRPVKSAEHTIAVLEYLAGRGEESARIREITEATGIPRSSAYALLQTLTERGWVTRDASGTLYGVGIRALIAGVSYIDADDRVQFVMPWLDRLRSDLDETVHLARLDGTDVVYLATLESNQYLRVINRVGRRLPASSTSLGKALLAARSDELVAEHVATALPALTDHTVTDHARLRDQLEQARKDGYAVECEENTPGLQCYGITLPYDDPPIDAISCSVPIARITPDREAAIITRLRATAEEIGRHGRSRLRRTVR